jgi:putative ABC transport system permease protein
MIPIKYNLRNLRVRWVTSLMTALGTGAVVWCSCILFGMVDGLQHSLNASGDPLDLVVFRKGSTTETTGGFSIETAQQITTLKGIARDSNGNALVSLELLNIPVAERKDGSHTNIIVRGVDASARDLRPNFTIIAGRYFEPGKDECVVSQKFANRFKSAALGTVLRVGAKEAYRVVGIFTANGSAAESEVWVDRRDLERNTAYDSYVSSVQLRAASNEDMLHLKNEISNNTRFKLKAQTEEEYFRSQDRSGLFLKVFGTVIAVLLTLGALFAAANTMFAAVSARIREIGTMRALGFSRSDVLISFLTESVILCGVGGAIGLLATIPLSRMTFGLTSFDSFAEMTVNFHMGPTVMIVAVAMTAAMGIFGGLFPALRAVRLDIVRALREL